MAKPTNPTEFLVVTLPWIIIISGVILNTFAAMIMMRKRFRSLSIGVYLFAMAILDTIFLLSNTLLGWGLRIISGVSIHALSEGGCKLVWYTMLASRSMSAWVLVVLCGERLLALAIPHLSATLNTRRRAVTSTVTVVILQGLMYTYNFFVNEVNSQGQCTISDSIVEKNHNLVINIFDFLNYSLIPSVIMATCNSVLVHLLCFSQQLRAESGGLDMRGIVVTVVVTSFAFITLTVPLTIYQVLSVAEVELGAPWVYPLLYSLDLLNHSINLVLYCKSGSRFRAELLSMCSCIGHARNLWQRSESTSVPMSSAGCRKDSYCHSNLKSVKERNTAVCAATVMDQDIEKVEEKGEPNKLDSGGNM